MRSWDRGSSNRWQPAHSSVKVIQIDVFCHSIMFPYSVVCVVKARWEFCQVSVRGCSVRVMRHSVSKTTEAANVS